MMRKAILAAVIVVVLSGCEREPQSYADCVLENIGPGMSNNAAELVHLACEKKFPEQAP